MKLSVIILNYNVRYFLEQCLISVQNALLDIDSEIIVVDNNSHDDSCLMVQQKFPQISLLQNKENVGFSKANNQAVKTAKGEYICILNPDTAVTENTFLECISIAEKSSTLGALGIQMIDGTGKFLPESKRNIPTPKKSLKKILGLINDKQGYYANNIAADGCGNIEVLAGAYIFMKRELYNNVGGFDEDYFMYGEDIDLSYKISKAGFKNYYLGTLQMLHYKGESTVRDEAYYNRFFGAMRIFYSKHFTANKLMNTSVNIAVAVAKKMKMFKNAKAKEPISQTKTVIIFSENEELFMSLAKVLDFPCSIFPKVDSFKNYGINNLVVFDANFISYSEIFNAMSKIKNQSNTFRIIPPNCNFMIGSDRSDEKGSVLHF